MLSKEITRCLLGAFILCFLFTLEAFGIGYFPGGEVVPETDPYWYLEHIRAYEAQRVACGEGITVVTVDSGVDFEHPALSGHLVLDFAYDFGDNDTDVMDFLGHGTAIAGLILQVAPCVKIIPLKINRDGHSFFETEALIAALQYTLELIRSHPEIRIVNLSLVLEEESDEVARLIREIRNAGVLIVGAAGNEGIFEVDFPASLPEVIAVSGTDIYDEPALSSNRGEEVLISAPAENLYVPSILGDYTYMSGTSMAAALVSGTLALVLEVLSERAELGLAEGSKDLGEPGYDPSYGFGRLSVLGALIAALSRELPVLPSFPGVLPGEEREAFFLPQENLKALILDDEIAEIASFRPNEGLIKIRGKTPGETELFLYRLSPLRATRIRVRVTDSPKNSFEVLFYPSIFDSRTPEVYFCYYLSIPSSGDFDLRLELVYPDEGRFVKTDLWTYSGFLSSGNYLDCLLTDPSLFRKGLQEILLCGEGSHCVRHLFYVK